MKLKNKRIYAVCTLLFLTFIFSIRVQADETNISTKGNNDVINFQQEYTDRKIDELYKKVDEKIADQQKSNENLIEVLKINLDEANQKNNHLLTFFQTASAIITLIVGAGIIVGGAMGIQVSKSIKKVNEIENDLKKKQEDVDESYLHIKNDLGKAQGSLNKFEEFSQKIDGQVDAIDNVRANLVGTIKDICGTFDQVKRAISDFKENGKIDELEVNLQTAAAQIEEVTKKEKDSNAKYIDKCEERVKSIVDFKIDEE
jgi:hypothetical protein